MPDWGRILGAIGTEFKASVLPNVHQREIQEENAARAMMMRYFDLMLREQIQNIGQSGNDPKEFGRACDLANKQFRNALKSMGMEDVIPEFVNLIPSDVKIAGMKALERGAPIKEALSFHLTQLYGDVLEKNADLSDAIISFRDNIKNDERLRGYPGFAGEWLQSQPGQELVEQAIDYNIEMGRQATTREVAAMEKERSRYDLRRTTIPLVADLLKMKPDFAPILTKYADQARTMARDQVYASYGFVMGPSGGEIPDISWNRIAADAQRYYQKESLLPDEISSYLEMKISRQALAVEGELAKRALQTYKEQIGDYTTLLEMASPIFGEEMEPFFDQALREMSRKSMADTAQGKVADFVLSLAKRGFFDSEEGLYSDKSEDEILADAADPDSYLNAMMNDRTATGEDGGTLSWNDILFDPNGDPNIEAMNVMMKTPMSKLRDPSSKMKVFSITRTDAINKSDEIFGLTNGVIDPSSLVYVMRGKPEDVSKLEKADPALITKLLTSEEAGIPQYANPDATMKEDIKRMEQLKADLKAKTGNDMPALGESDDFILNWMRERGLAPDIDVEEYEEASRQALEQALERGSREQRIFKPGYFWETGADEIGKEFARSTRDGMLKKFMDLEEKAAKIGEISTEKTRLSGLPVIMPQTQSFVRIPTGPYYSMPLATPGLSRNPNEPK